MSFAHTITEKVLTSGRELTAPNAFSGDGQVIYRSKGNAQDPLTLLGQLFVGLVNAVA